MLNRLFIIPSFTWSFPAVICLIAGIFCTTFFTSLLFWSFLSLISLLIGFFLFVRNYTRLMWWWFFVITTFTSGVLRTVYAHVSYENTQKISLFHKTSLKVQLVEIEMNESKKHPYCYTFSLYSSQLSSYFTIPFVVKMYCSQPFEGKIGDVIELKNSTWLHTYKKDYQRYLMKEGILATIFVDHIESTFVEHQKGIQQIFTSLKAQTFSHLKKHIQPSTFALFSPIFLGNKTLIDQKFYQTIKQSFKYWGIMHYLARSGLHVVLVIGLYLILLKMLPCSFFLKQLLLGFLLLLYMLLSWSSVSFLRAFIAYFFTQFCLFNWVWPPLLHVICCTCLITLLFNPFQLFFLDFQLSFFLTFCLSLFISNFKKTIV